eukprot:GHVO01021514.1.p3 GENE.GHVO01021514.1~~GHVO01021514.1.p3  ORF type:complete len:129 (-),score=20.82 GHVO01021514.1:675-1061(-)
MMKRTSVIDYETDGFKKLLSGATWFNDETYNLAVNLSAKYEFPKFEIDRPKFEIDQCFGTLMFLLEDRGFGSNKAITNALITKMNRLIVFTECRGTKYDHFKAGRKGVPTKPRSNDDLPDKELSDSQK